MSDDVFVPYDEFPKPHTGSFLTAKEIESFKDAFKDFVHVVRCKDCKHRNAPANGVPFCKRIKNFVGADWFCADGERKEGR